MKGRNNQKPDQKYHNIIMELLKQPFIKGIKGGGYKPENNFRLSDLNDERYEEMLSLKPELGEPLDQYIYNDRTVTPELVSKLDSILSDDIGLGFVGYDEQSNRFILEDGLGSAEDIFDGYSQESSEVYPNEDPIAALTDDDIVYEALVSEEDEIIDEFREVIEEYLKGIVADSMEQQIDSLDEYNYDERSSGIFFDKDENGSYQLVADPEQFLETDLPKVMDGETSNWMHITAVDYLRDPNEDWKELLDGYDDEQWKYLAEHIAESIKNKPGFSNAMEVGTHPGAEAEQKAGQMRMFDSKGKRK
jgi:hypothetical protein